MKFHQVDVFEYLNSIEKPTSETKEVRRVSYESVIPFLLDIHYARRMPCVTDAFGLFINEVLVGVITYGIPASHQLCVGIAGEQNARNVKELNRLCLLPEYNGGVKTLHRFLWDGAYGCLKTERSLCRTPILDGDTRGIYTRRRISYIRDYRQRERTRTNLTGSIRDISRMMITSLGKQGTRNTGMCTLSVTRERERGYFLSCGTRFCRIRREMM